MKIGKVTENVLKRSILQQIKTKREQVIGGADLGEDCAIFSLNPGVSGTQNDSGVMLSCVQGSALKIESTLLKCKNILASRGADGIAAALHILLPAHAEEQTLKEIMVSAEKTCAVLGMQIAQAQSRVSEAINSAYVTVTAYGVIPEPALSASKSAGRSPAEAYHTVKAAKPGQDIVISKWIGLEGTALLAQRDRESVLQRYPVWLVEEAAEFEKYLSTVPEAAVAIKSGVCALYNLSEGGVLAALWELAEGAGVGLTIDLKKLPIRQETVEICNHLNVNPYELLSGGSLLMTTTDGEALTGAMREAGIPAVIVGRTTDSNDRLILNEDEVRYLDRPHEDSIYQR